MDSPIFLLASERSGTNLLRRRLTENQLDVIGPQPLHLLKHLYFAEPYYGDLSIDENFVRLIEDALGLAYHHFSPWDITVTASQVFNAYTEVKGQSRSSVGVMHVLYTMYARSKGYKTYFCKDNNLFDFVNEIRTEIPQARFIYLYRDPRDVVLSQLQRPTQVKSVSYLARLWRDEQIKCIRHSLSLLDERRIFRVSYEDFVRDERSVIDGLCDAYELEPAREIKCSFKNESSDIHEWSNLNRPTMVDNVDKYRGSLSKNNIRKIEGICWHQMHWLGYQPTLRVRPKISIARGEMEIIASKIFRSLRSRAAVNGITDGQLNRNRYIRGIQAKWR